MAEQYHDDLLAYLRGEQQRINAAINAVMELARNGVKYKPDDHAAVLIDIQTKVGDAATEYKGRARPSR